MPRDELAARGLANFTHSAKREEFASCYTFQPTAGMVIRPPAGGTGPNLNIFALGIRTVF